MFQNINVEERIDSAEDEATISKISTKERIAELFTKQRIILYIISFMLSMVSTVNDIAPFGIAIFTSTLACGLPCGVVFILGLIGTWIGIGSGAVINYLLTALVFTIMVLIFKPWYQEEYKSERRKAGKYVVLSVIASQIIQLLFMFKGILLYDVCMAVVTSVVTYIFYKIFANSITVISEFGITKAFTVEEVVGASLMLEIAVCAFGELAVFGVQVKTVISILIVLVLGWKHGILVGASSGVTIGAVLGLVGGEQMSLVASFALSGMLAGVLSRFGRVGVIIGFVVGGVVLSFVPGAGAPGAIYLKEMVIASLGLLLVPKNVKINIEDFFGKELYLPVASPARLERCGSGYSVQTQHSLRDNQRHLTNIHRRTRQRRSRREQGTLHNRTYGQANYHTRQHTI